MNDDLTLLKEGLYDKCNLTFSDFNLHKESAEYGACSFLLNGKFVQHRMAKITPKKIGQFVTVWKRNNVGITEPFDVADELDFIFITTKSENHLGQFIFPKEILVEKGIITKGSKGGKRGMRVYPPWDIPTNKQAMKTQSWQLNYFFSLEHPSQKEIGLIKDMFI